MEKTFSPQEYKFHRFQIIVAGICTYFSSAYGTGDVDDDVDEDNKVSELNIFKAIYFLE